MSLEWQIAIGLMGGVSLLILRQAKHLPLWARLVFPTLVIGATMGARSWESRVVQQRQSWETLRELAPDTTTSRGYVGSARCQSCHPQEYDSWHHSYHRTMTQPAMGDAVLGTFDDTSLMIDGHKIDLERRGEEYWVEMVDPDWIHDFAKLEQAYAQGRSPTPPSAPASPPRTRKRVTMTTGSHHYQVLWVPSKKIPNVQFALPITWLIADQRWVARKDVFIMDPDRKSPVQVWNLTCIQCHSTSGRPRKDSRTNLFDTDVAEHGIACEACHGPGEDHVNVNSSALRRYQLHLSGEVDESIINPARLESDRAAEICGQCHGVRWQLDQQSWATHGFRYQPGDSLEASTPILRRSQLNESPWAPPTLQHNREFLDSLFWPDGMIRVAGRELNGLLETGCYQVGEMSCLSCHSMHHSSPDDQLAKNMETNEACLQCHDSLRTTLEQHTHHNVNSSGSLCYNCHMPHATYGLLKAIRNHQIDSPSVAETIEAGRPNACNLCHLDKPLSWTATHLEDWFDQRHPTLDTDQESASSILLHLSKGDAAQRALSAWALGWKPAQRVAGRDWMAPFLAELLTDPYPAVRYIAYQSLKKLPGYLDLDYDFTAPSEQRNKARQTVIQQWEQEQKGTHFREPQEFLLLKQDGGVDRDRLTRLILKRDHRPVFLVE